MGLKLFRITYLVGLEHKFTALPFLFYTKHVLCREYVRKQLDEYKEVYFIFDRYYDHSIKGEERLSRAKGLTRTFVLQPGA